MANMFRPDESAPTEIWWMQVRLWPFVLRVEATVLLEARPRLPGMKSYQCVWNDFVWLFWRMLGKDLFRQS